MFKIAFVVIATFIATKFLFAGDRWNLGTELPGPVPMTLYGFGIGLAGSLMGVSGGSLSNIVLTLYGKSIHQAVATSAGLGVPITIVGTIGYMLAGLPHQALLPPLSLGFVSLIGRRGDGAGRRALSRPTARGSPTACRGARWKSRSAASCCWSSVRFLVSLV